MDEDEQTRIAVRDAVIRQIETAFDGVDRAGGVSLHEAFAIDTCVSDKQQAKARKRDTETRWQDVPAADIEEHYSILSYLDPIGLRYYIPAYMVWTLKNYEHSASLSVNHPIYSLRHLSKNDKFAAERIAMFSRPQAEAICAFLRFMGEYAAHHADDYAAQQAIDWHWGRFCPPNDPATEREP